MAIGRTEDRNTPGNPLGHVPRRDVWGPIRVTHLGPRSTRPHIKAGHMTAIDQTRPQLQQVASDRPGVRAGVRKPPKKEPAGERRAVGRLWGFGSAAALPGDGLLENC
jgi:hypothetical protein